MPDPMTTPPRMTAVFEYDLKQHPGNPFHTDTPFGRPLVLELGDFSEADCEAVAEDRGTANPPPRADLCADPALLAEAEERLTELTAALEAFWAADEAAEYAEQFGMTQDPAENLSAGQIKEMRARATELWQAIPSHATAARAFIAKLEARQ